MFSGLNMLLDIVAISSTMEPKPWHDICTAQKMRKLSNKTAQSYSRPIQKKKKQREFNDIVT